MSARLVGVVVWAVVIGALVATPSASGQGTENGEWRSYGGDIKNSRYSPLDQINASNFDDLEIAWRIKMSNFGPNPEYNFQSTPLMVDGVIYSTAGSRRAVVAADAGTGELLWMHRFDEGERGAVTPRRLSGRGLAYRDDGTSGQIVYVTLGYQLIVLDAATGQRVSSFGTDGVVDLMQNMDQDIDPLAGEIGLHAAPLVVGDTIVIGAAHVPGSAPRSMRNTKGYVRGFDADTGSRKWIFHTIPGNDEFGNDSWLNDSWRYTGNTGVWGQISADLEEGIVYFATEMPTNDYYGGHRHGDNLFSDSLVAVDIDSGDRLWHFQAIHHDVWDWDAAQIPVLVDTDFQGRMRKLLLWPNRNAFYYVLDRITGELLLVRPFAQQTWAQGIDSKGRPIIKPEAIPTDKGVVVFPGIQGATNWFSPSYSPQTDLLYVAIRDVPTFLSANDVEYDPGGLYLGSRWNGLSEDPSWANIRALIPQTGEVKWAASPYPTIQKNKWGPVLKAGT